MQNKEKKLKENLRLLLSSTSNHNNRVAQDEIRNSEI
jgi:hypothetical protein